MDIRKLQKTVIAALEDIKARDIEAFDVAHLTSEFDRVIVASADSARQTKALANNVREKAKQAGALTCRTEGEEGGEWVLVDLGDIVVHIMQPGVRAHYNLEELWNHPRPKPAPKPKAAPRDKTAGALRVEPEKRPRPKPKSGARPAAGSRTTAKRGTKMTPGSRATGRPAVAAKARAKKPQA